MKSYNFLIAIVLLLSTFSFNIFAQDITTMISVEQWAIPRHGERILKIPAIKEVIRQWHLNQHQMIQINYPGGENGELWLTELKDWLIALGVPSTNIKSIAGSGSKDIIKLTVVKEKGN